MALSDEHRELISRLQPVGLPDIPCLECEPSVDGLTVEHAALCPVMISIESATRADRVWFEEHPYSDHYYRPITWGEAADLATTSEIGQKLSATQRFSVVGKVRVERMTDDARIRKFDGIYFMPE